MCSDTPVWGRKRNKDFQTLQKPKDCWGDEGDTLSDQRCTH